MTTTTFHTQLVLVPALLVVALATPASAQIPTGTVMVGTGSGLYSEFTQTGTLLAQLDTTTTDHSLSPQRSAGRGLGGGAFEQCQPISNGKHLLSAR